jgi:putative acetyltransferase
MLDIKIRDEAPADVEAISTVTQEAFRRHPYSRQTKAGIIIALREAKVLTLSLVAEYENRVVGHIAFSPVSISDDALDWYGIEPLPVIPDLQGQGISMTLVQHSLERLRRLGGKGCVLVGIAILQTFWFSKRFQFSPQGYSR